ncbi:MAG TPA: DUF4249 domain-containing protein [Niastella sp.]
MKLFEGILLLIAGISLSGCSKKVIKVDLKTAPVKLVIDASIDWLKNTPGNEQSIKLSTTTGYYNDEFPTVSGATIFITNSTNTVFNFPESANKGEYICNNFKPVIGETYKLTITLNGVTYAATETFIGTPDIDNNILQNTAGGMTGDEIEIQYSYLDNGSQDNYYVSRISSNRVAYPQYFLENDENFQGKKMTQFYSHEDLAVSDALNIRFYGTSRRFFDYFKKIVVASGNDDSPFPTTPTEVRGNIINQTDAEKYVLGYFRLSEVVSRDYTIK